MKKLICEFRLEVILPEDLQHLSERELLEKYYEYAYDYFRTLKDKSIFDNEASRVFFTKGEVIEGE